MKRPLITFTTDFGVQTQGIGIMEATALSICENAHIIHLIHGLPDFDIMAAARSLETVQDIPVGFHICVVDPGVGTNRRGIIIKTKRGDYFIGPDNGVFIPATYLLGGAEKVIELMNEKYMRKPISPIFHGRDVFTPAAAHLACGVPMEEFGKEIFFEDLMKAPYEEAVIDGDTLKASVIYINKYGSLHLNILSTQWDTFGVKKGKKVELHFSKKTIEVPYVATFGEVELGKPLIIKDDYGRVEIAINQGNFVQTYGIQSRDACTIRRV